MLRNEADGVFEKVIHIGSGFEKKLADSLPVAHIHTRPGSMHMFNGRIILDAKEYLKSTPDMSIIPKGMSRYSFFDKCRDNVQSSLIESIESDRGNFNTFILFVRPIIEASTTIYTIKLQGIWVVEKNVNSINAPDELEDPFPAE